MKAILVGAVESTKIALKCLAASAKWDLAAVFTLPPDLSGRHSDFVDLAEEAARAGDRAHREHQF
jgi:methionyl-tRNA formyltransferase